MCSSLSVWRLRQWRRSLGMRRRRPRLRLSVSLRRRGQLRTFGRYRGAVSAPHCNGLPCGLRCLWRRRLRLVVVQTRGRKAAGFRTETMSSGAVRVLRDRFFWEFRCCFRDWAAGSGPPNACHKSSPDSGVRSSESQSSSMGSSQAACILSQKSTSAGFLYGGIILLWCGSISNPNADSTAGNRF